MRLGRLYLVATPRAGQPEPEFLARLEAALDGGVDTLQLRCKDWEAGAYIALGERVAGLSRARGVPLFINTAWMSPPHAARTGCTWGRGTCRPPGRAGSRRD